MSRGFLSGAAWGTVVAGFGLVVASQVSELPSPEKAETPVVEQTEVVVAEPAVEAAPEPVAEAAAPIESETAPEPALESQVAEEVVVEAAPVAEESAEPVSPQAESAAPAMPQDAVPDLAEVPTGGASTPMLPESSASPVTANAPQGLGTETAAHQPASDTQIATIPETQTEAPGAEPPMGAIPAPEVSVTEDAAPSQANSRVAELPDSALADTPPADPDLPPPAPEETVTAQPPEPLPDADPEQVAVPAQDGLTDTAPELSTIVTSPRPAPGFGGKVEGVRTGRLPSIGSTASEPLPDAAVSSEADEVAPVIVVDDANSPAIDRYARAFENADNKPLFAILLQDTGGPDVDREALAKMPFPVSFVIDPTQPDAAVAARIYRDAGQEVLMLATGIPAGATASDLAVSFEVTDSVLPEAVGVVDVENGGFQGNRTLAAQVLAVISDQGRGVLTWDRGLNAASQIARREGMRSAVIFRALDADGESAPVIRRYLDRAAFKAAQDGRVVVAGKTRPETVAALLEWAVEGRAATVAIAPSSAVMTAQ